MRKRVRKKAEKREDVLQLLPQAQIVRRSHSCDGGGRDGLRLDGE